MPNPGNPLDWDRFSYVRNNPLRCVDPSGHEPCFEDGYCIEGSHSEEDHLSFLSNLYKIKFSGAWKTRHKWAVVTGVQALAHKLASTQNTAVHAAIFFQETFGLSGKNKFNFEWGCDFCSGFGWTAGAQKIQFRDMYSAMFKNITLVVHELFHAFENAMQITNVDGRTYKAARATLPPEFSRAELVNRPPFTWQQSGQNTSGEIFADLGIAWVFGKWSTSPLAIDMSKWMNNEMPRFIDIAQQNQRNR